MILLILKIQSKILTLTNNKKIDLILSDIAPDNCGHKETDHLRLIEIVEKILIFLHENLAEGGNFVCKVFLGQN